MSTRHGACRGKSIARVAVAAVLLLLAAVPSAAGGSQSVPRFRHVMVVVFENKERSAIVGNPAAPTFASLARTYASLDGL